MDLSIVRNLSKNKSDLFTQLRLNCTGCNMDAD